MALFFGKLSRRAKAWLYNHAPKVRQITKIRIFTDIRAVSFKVKELAIFFLIFVGGSFAGNFINDYFGLTTGEGMLAYAFSLCVPVLVIYLIWKYWGEKASKA